MLSKKLNLVALVLLGSSLLISCGGGSGDSSNSQQPTGTNPPVSSTPDPTVDQDSIPFTQVKKVQFDYKARVNGVAKNSGSVVQNDTSPAEGMINVPSSGLSFQGNIIVSIDAFDGDEIAAVYAGFPNSGTAMVLCSADCGTQYHKTVTGVDPSQFGLFPGSHTLELLVEDNAQNRVIVDRTTFSWSRPFISGIAIERVEGSINVSWQPLSGYLRYNIYVNQTASANASFDASTRNYLAIPSSSFSITGLEDQGQFNIRVTGINGSGESASSDIINIKPLAIAANENPVADNDEFQTNEDVSFSGSLLSNDTDAEQDPLSVVVENTSRPTNGSVQIQENGNFTYTPAANFNGIDSFSYQITDGNSGFDNALVTIDILPINDPPIANEDSYAANEDEVLEVSSPGLLENDADIDSESFFVVSVSSPSSGSVNFGPDGSFSYTPKENFSGIDSFEYTVSDGELPSSATVTINVGATNDPPVAVSDSFEINEDETLNDNVLLNDFDPDGEAVSLTASLVSDTQNGRLNIGSDGNFTYIPSSNFHGVDSFTYQIEDEAGLTAQASAQITVINQSDPPIANSDNYNTDEDVELIINASEGLLSNDIDPDGGEITVSSSTSAQNGSVSVNSDGSFRYKPEEHFFGIDSFEYTIKNTEDKSSSASVTITVTGLPDAPVTADDEIVVQVGEQVTLSPIANDRDPDGGKLTLASASASHGTVTISGNELIYTAPGNYVGEATIDYSVANNQGRTANGTIKVTIEGSISQPPVANEDSATTRQNEPITIDVISNDTDPEQDALRVSAVSTPSNGTATISSSGTTVTYTPNTDFVGEDSFTYTVTDGKGNNVIGNVTVRVISASAVPPVATNDSAEISPGGEISIDVLSNDTHATNATLTIESVSQPSQGTATINGSQITYTANSDATGSDSFTYTIKEPEGLLATGTVTITITSVVANRPPVAVADSASTTPGTTVTIDVLANDSDPDTGDSLTVTDAFGASNGNPSFTRSNVSYTPNSGFTGTDTFNYTISDISGTTASSTVTVTVSAAASSNSPPVPATHNVAMTAGTTQTFSPLSFDTDPDGDSLSIAGVSLSGGLAGASASTNGTTVTITLPATQQSTVTVNYVLSDGSLTANGTITITVTTPSVTGSHDVDGDGQPDLIIAANGSDFDITLPAEVESVYYIDSNGVYIPVEPQADGTYQITADGTTTANNKTSEITAGAIPLDLLYFVVGGYTHSINLGNLANNSNVNFSTPTAPATGFDSANIQSTYVYTLDSYIGQVRTGYRVGDKITLSSGNSGTVYRPQMDNDTVTWSLSGSLLSLNFVSLPELENTSGNVHSLVTLGVVSQAQADTYISGNSGSSTITYYTSTVQRDFTFQKNGGYFIDASEVAITRYRVPAILSSTTVDITGSSTNIRLLDLSKIKKNDFAGFSTLLSSTTVLPMFKEVSSKFDSFYHDKFSFSDGGSGTSGSGSAVVSGLSFTWTFEELTTGDHVLKVTFSNGWIIRYRWLHASVGNAVLAELEDTTNTKFYSYHNYMVARNSFAGGAFGTFATSQFLEHGFELADPAGRDSSGNVKLEETFGFYISPTGSSPNQQAKRIYYSDSVSRLIDQDYYWKEVAANEIEISIRSNQSSGDSFKYSYAQCIDTANATCFTHRKRTWELLQIDSDRIWVLEREDWHTNSTSGLSTFQWDTNDNTLDYEEIIPRRVNFYQRITPAPGNPNSISFNQEPIAATDTVYVTMNTARTHIKLKDNDTDPEADSLTINSVTATTGTIVLNGDQTVTYTPVTSATGSVSGTYELTDGTNIITGNITFNISADTDGDGVPDNLESSDGTASNNAMLYKDSDGDSIPDFFEDGRYGNDPNSADGTDSDSDGVNDYIEAFPGPNDKPVWINKNWYSPGTNAYDLTITDGSGVSNDNLGLRNALNDDITVTAAPYHASNDGAIYIVVDQDQNGTFSETVEKISAPNTSGGEEFGIDLAVMGKAILAGAHFADDNGANSGAAYLYYDYDADGSYADETAVKLLASDPAAGDLFGYSVAMSDGIMAIGAPGKNTSTGAVYIYHDADLDGDFTDDTVVKITASDGATGDNFGHALAFYKDTLVVGAYGDNSDKGSVYVYYDANSDHDYSNDTESKLEDINGSTGDKYGFSVDLFEKTLAIGAYAYGTSDTGAVHVLQDRDNDKSWADESPQLLQPADGGTSDYFGRSVAISDLSIFVGAPNADGDTTDSGTVYVFSDSDDDGNFFEETYNKLHGGGGGSTDKFGYHVDAHNGAIATGAHGQNSDIGKAFRVELINTVYIQEGSSTVGTFTANDADGNDVTYWLYGGDDAAKFAINSTSGALTFQALPLWSAPTDSNSDNIYKVKLKAMDSESAHKYLSLNVVVTPDFNTKGTLINKDAHDQFANNVLTQSDGKIVVHVNDSDGALSQNMLYRYKANGTTDTTFNSIGNVVARAGTGNEGGTGLVIQHDDKIVIGGNYVNSSNTNFVLFRYTTAGVLDSTFSGDGIYQELISSTDSGNSLIQQKDGKLVLAGSSSGGTKQATLLRLKADGTLDASFDSDGKRVDDLGSGYDSQLTQVIQQMDGKLTAAGWIDNSGNLDVLVSRYKADGALDTTFNSTGSKTYTVGASGEKAESIVQLNNGQLLVAGHYVNSSALDLFLLRINSDGTLDTGFDGDGKVMYTVGNTNTSEDLGVRLLIQPDGKYLVSFGKGTTDVGQDFGLVRFSTDGTLDTSFDGDGLFTSAIAPLQDKPHGLALQPDGKVLATGFVNQGLDKDFYVIRLNANGTLDGVNTALDTDSDGVPDQVELQQTTDKSIATNYLDTDNDGVPDYIEQFVQFTPHDDAEHFLDTDKDGVPDYFETGTYGTDINTPDAVDTDNDGVIDYVEAFPGVNDLPEWDVNSWNVNSTETATLTATDGAANDEFGLVTAQTDQILVVGALKDDTERGSVYVYFDSDLDRSFSDETAEKLTASDAADYDHFGVSIAIDHDILVIGAGLDDDKGSNSGSVYIYYDSDDDGSFADETPEKITAYDGAASDEFGRSVAIDDNLLVIGSPNASSNGVVYVYRDSNFDNKFSDETPQKLTASDGAASDLFGFSVAVEQNTIVIGAYNDDDKGTDSGSAYVFTDTDNDQLFSDETQQKLVAIDGAAGDLFGYSVSVEDKTVAIGAYNHASAGAAYVYFDNDSDGLYSDEIAQKLQASNGGASDLYGKLVAVADNAILIGAPGYDTGQTDIGSLYLYQDADHDGFYTEEREVKLLASSAVASDSLGYSASLESGIIAVGVHKANSLQGKVLTFNGFAVAHHSDENLNVGSLKAKDEDGQTVTYAITGGADQSKFTISSSTGALSFSSAVNYSSPSDVGTDNNYEVTVKASDTSGGTEIPYRIRISSLFDNGYQSRIHTSGTDYGISSIAEASNEHLYIAGSQTISSASDISLHKFAGPTLSTKVQDLTSNDFGFDVIEQQDGKIVVAGDSNNGLKFAVVRYLSDGTTLDTSFNSTGKYENDFSGNPDRAYAVIQQQDGKLVAAGSSENGGTTDFIVVRFNENGTLDTSFDSNGNTLTNGVGYNDIAYDLIQQHDGKIVAVGSSDNNSNLDHFVVRYNTDGSLDTSFDSDGKLIINGGSNESLHSITQQSDGKLLMAGYQSNGSNDDVFVMRLNLDGTLDTTFDTDGKAIFNVTSSGERANAIIQTSKGQLALVGYASNGSNKDMLLMQLNNDGSLDVSFDGKSGVANGSIVLPIGTGDDKAADIIETDSNKLAIVGELINGSDTDGFIVRALNDGKLDEGTDTDGDGVPDHQESSDGTNANSNTSYKDTDTDGVPDYVEFHQNTDSSNIYSYLDSDDDVVPDYFETGTYATNVNVSDAVDTDSDGIIDYIEAFKGVDNKVTFSYADSFDGIKNIPTIAGEIEDMKLIDMDGDTDLDIVTADANNNAVSWYENKGTGEYLPHLISNTLIDVRTIEPVDLDGDSDTDIIVSAHYDTTKLVWLENNGSQSFTERSLDTSTDSYGIKAIDIDGDTDIDIVATAYTDDKLLLFRNDGSENFTKEEIDTNASGLDGPRDVAVGHINGDSDLDIVIASQINDSAIWYQNNGNNTFTKNVINTSVNSARQIIIAELNGDSYNDIAVSGLSTLQIYTADNSGFSSFTTHTLTHSSTTELIKADYDGDSYPDLLAVSSSQNYPTHYEWDGSSAFTTTALSGVINEGSDINDIVSLNYDSTNNDDFLIAQETTGSISLHYDSSGSYKSKYVSGMGGAPNHIHTTDIDKDNDSDVLVIVDSSDVVQFKNYGSGSFSRKQLNELTSATMVSSGDLSSDSDTDYVVAASSLHLYTNNSGTYSVTTIGSYSNYTQVYMVDIDKDLDLDIIAVCTSCSSGVVELLTNNGSNSFSSTALISSNYLTKLEFADVDGNTHTDIIGINAADGSITWLDHSGGLSFTQKTLQAKDSSNFVDFAITNLDGDSDNDLLTVDSNHLNYYQNSGSLVYKPRTIYHSSVTLATTDLAVFDTDGDTDNDIVLAAGEDNEIFLFENTGNEDYVRKWIDNFTSSPSHLQVVDLNGDGSKEIIASSTSAKNLSYYQHQTEKVLDLVFQGCSSGCSCYTTPTIFASAIDLDGDTISYSLNGGVDVSLFAINSTTGEITFNTAPNPISPTDNNSDGTYEFNVTATANSIAVTVKVKIKVEDYGEGEM